MNHQDRKEIGKMPKIKIDDLTVGAEISKEEMRRVMGGTTYAMASSPYYYPLTSYYPVRPANPYAVRPFFQVEPQMASGCICAGMAQDPVECVQMPG